MPGLNELYRDFIERRMDEIIEAIGHIDPGGGGTFVPITITANGTYHAQDYQADGFEPVIVNVPRVGGLEVHEKQIYSSTYTIIS